VNVDVRPALACLGKSERPQDKQELMMHISLALLTLNCMTTFCPSASEMPKPENILKTKDRESPFPPTKPENILKAKPVTINHTGREIA
jgi:hypothetical protein